MKKRFGKSLLPGLALAVGIAAYSGSADAQALNFVVQNDLSPVEALVSAQQGNLAAPTANGASLAAQGLQSNTAFGQGAANIQAQNGQGNVSRNFVRDSQGAATGSFQLGQRNSSVGVVSNSPGSVIAQYQAGSRLSSNVFVVGGNNNNVSTVQIGNKLGANVALVDSQDTTVVYGQVGRNYGGSITFRNAPAGTVIRLR